MVFECSYVLQLDTLPRRLTKLYPMISIIFELSDVQFPLGTYLRCCALLDLSRRGQKISRFALFDPTLREAHYMASMLG